MNEKRVVKRYTLSQKALENMEAVKAASGVRFDTAVIEWAVAELAIKLLALHPSGASARSSAVDGSRASELVKVDPEWSDAGNRNAAGRG